MRQLCLGTVGVVSALVLSVACGSSGTGPGNPAVDPDALDFCLRWANDVCRMAYSCVAATAQDSAFHARYGKSMDDCWQSVEKYCTSNQSGSQTFGPSCGPGKKVDTTAASACADALETDTCAEWQAAPAGACDAVCSTSGASGGSGGMSSGGSGTAGSGASGTPGSGGSGTAGSGASTGGAGSVATSTDFCNSQINVSCDRAFECDSASATAQFGTLAGCKALASIGCVGTDPCPGGYNATLAAACVAATKTATCAQLMGDPPTVCTSACQ